MSLHTVKLGRHTVGDGCDPFVVAEIGQNHNGDVYTAIRMISEARKCGADAVKFQLRSAADEYCGWVLNKPHPDKRNAFGKTYREHRAVLDLNVRELWHIKERMSYNQWDDIEFFVTPCDVRCVDPLERMEVPFYKVASKDTGNIPLLQELNMTGKPVILSTGMSNLQDVEMALAALHGVDVIILQCTSSYPCDPTDVHLNAMVEMRHIFGKLVGISDHTVGVLVPSLAVAMGACLVEKHFTLARAQPGTDHAGALEPRGLEIVCRDCRLTPKILGSSVKRITESSGKAYAKLGRSIVAAKHMIKGEVITEADLALKAPGTGLPWHERMMFIGRAAAHEIPRDTILAPEHVA